MLTFLRSLSLVLVDKQHVCAYLQPFLHARASKAIACISFGNSVLVSWCLSRPGTVPRQCEIETSSFHHMIATVSSIS